MFASVAYCCLLEAMAYRKARWQASHSLEAAKEATLLVQRWQRSSPPLPSLAP